ncbi:glycosyltransferase [Marinilabiliaceae bacterium JC017]|nr:glycosyltransferase [Marinilabiliaceae bacterium JC017]
MLWIWYLNTNFCTKLVRVMKILFVSPGNFTHIEPYLEFFSKKGHIVGFLALSETELHSDSWRTFEPVLLKFGKFQYLLTTLYRKKLVKAFNPDIVHAHYATSGGLCGCLLGLHPLVVTAHGTDLTEGKDSILWRPLLKRIFRFSDSINVVSSGLAKMAQELGVPENKLLEVNVGIDMKTFRFEKSSKDGKKRSLKMVTTRRFEPVYNHQFILEALRLVDQRNLDFQMTFIGGGPLKNGLEKAYADLVEKGKVVFMGQVINSELPGILIEHDVYLSASLWDGSSLSLIEALASGLFPIVSNIPANQAWVTDNINGFLHELREPLDLANKILTYKENISAFSQVLSMNRELVENKGNRITNMRKLEKLYHTLIGA